MLLEEVRKAVQPELEQDFDALFEEFIAERGEGDVVEFLMHLHDFGLISEGLVRRLAAEGTLAAGTGEPAPPPPIQPIAWDDDPADDGEATVLAKASDLIKMTEQAAAEAAPLAEPPPESPTLSPRPRDPLPSASPEPPPEPPSPKPRPTPPPAESGAQTPTAPGNRAVGALPFLNEFAESTEDVQPTQKRTMFRKRSDGNWQETDQFSRTQKPQVERQRRRSQPPKLAITRDESRYTFLETTVGEGAMGKVILARDNVLKRQIAYKEMSDEIAGQPALASKFSAEAQITAQLEHPNIVPVYALEGDVAYTMKLVKGRTVEDLIRETRQLVAARKPLDEDHSLEARLDLFLKVCDAIAFANAQGVVHRDLKPENIMVGQFGEVYVMDWGIAMLMKGVTDGPEIQAMEDEGELIIGTAGYMSPEQADGRNDELTGASDQYALGLILQELVGLRPAVSGKNAVHILTRQQLGETDRMLPFGSEPIPTELRAIIAKATQFKPERRYASVDALADDVRRFLRGEAVRAKPDNPWQALVRWTGRHRQATLVVVMLAIFFSVFSVMGVGIYAQVYLSRAAAREAALSGLVTSVGRQSSHIDGQFTRLKGLLHLVSTTAEDMLVLGDAGGRRIYMTDEFASTTYSPPGTAPSARYGIPVSPQHAAVVLAPDTPAGDAQLYVPRLAPMDRHFQKVMLRSLSEEAAQYAPKRAARAIAEVGVPIVWAYVALENGAYTVFPGHAGYPASFDPRKLGWYQAAKSSTGSVWGPPTRDEDGGSIGDVMTCSTALRDSEGELLGVAGIDVSFSWIANELTALEGLAEAGGSVFVLDAQGRVVIDPSGGTDPLGLAEMANPTLLAGIQARRSGHVEIGREIVVYTRMTGLDWYYVVRGPTEAMLAHIR